jgi:hypothetical protein
MHQGSEDSEHSGEEVDSQFQQHSFDIHRAEKRSKLMQSLSSPTNIGLSNIPVAGKIASIKMLCWADYVSTITLHSEIDIRSGDDMRFSTRSFSSFDAPREDSRRSSVASPPGFDPTIGSQIRSSRSSSIIGSPFTNKSSTSVEGGQISQAAPLITKTMDSRRTSVTTTTTDRTGTDESSGVSWDGGEEDKDGMIILAGAGRGSDRFISQPNDLPKLKRNLFQPPSPSLIPKVEEVSTPKVSGFSQDITRPKFDHFSASSDRYDQMNQLAGMMNSLPEVLRSSPHLQPEPVFPSQSSNYSQNIGIPDVINRTNSPFDPWLLNSMMAASFQQHQIGGLGISGLPNPVNSRRSQSPFSFDVKSPSRYVKVWNIDKEASAETLKQMFIVSNSLVIACLD